MSREAIVSRVSISITLITMSNMNPVVHFEMPAEDRKRMSEFYAKTFGWKTQQLGPEMGNYVIVHTGETDENNMVKNPGMINGGFYEKTEDPLSNYPSIVISVEDIKAHVKEVEAAGGKVVSEVMEIPGVGLFASFVDTEGNRVSMLQSFKM